MPRADAASRKYECPNGISCFFQVNDRFVEPHIDEVSNISPQQMKYVTHTEAGEGLLFYGNVILPFVDHFPKDTKLYKVMTTKPEEVSGE